MINLSKNKNKLRSTHPWFMRIHQVDDCDDGGSFFYFISIVSAILLPLVAMLVYALVMGLIWMVGGDTQSVDRAVTGALNGHWEVIGRVYCWAVLVYFVFWITVDVKQRRYIGRAY